MAKKYKISASLMCADLGNLEREIKKLEKARVDFLHIDIMDGHFVPNLTFGPDLVKKVRKITKLPLDIHLMVDNPEKFISIWEVKKNDLITFHIETTHHPQRILESIKETRVQAGIALNPSTPLNSLYYILGEMDIILLMTVNPGFAGQKWIPSVLEKIKRLNKILQEKGLKTQIQVDGNIGEHNISLLKKAGANIFVAGSSSIFVNPRYYQNVARMRKFIKQ